MKPTKLFWGTKGNQVLGATALPLYGAFVSEETCHFFDEAAGKKVLEIGCGSGHSLQFLGSAGHLNYGELILPGSR